MTNLFAAAGLDLPSSGGGRTSRSTVRSLRQPLFNHRVLEDALNLQRARFSPTPEQTKAAKDYAKRLKSANFRKQSEVAVRPIFISEIFEKLLGYSTLNHESAHTLAYEHPIRSGAVDVALGNFSHDGTPGGIVAPLEIRGPGTTDLDAVMPGRGRSPVQQAWDYAIDAPGSRWVLVSNCIEIRLYGFGRGREAYEVFDLSKLGDADQSEFERLWFLLSAEHLLGGTLDKLLRDTDSAYKDVTNKLYVEYRSLRDRLFDFIVNGADGPRLPAAQAIEPAQKILDRVLFVAFAQKTDLLPDRLLERASQQQNEFNPEPVWKNFASLFRAIDKGNTRLNIWPYNGGLFKEDPVTDAIILPDALAGEVADLGKWDYRRQVPVTVLGHIFEQSITDLEKLRAEARGESPPQLSKRKREGVVYTPDVITRFLVEATIGTTLKETFEALWVRHGISEDAPAEQELPFWRDYMEALRDLTVCDPACGSGAFLVAAFDSLAGEYRRAALRLEALGEPIAFDIFDQIVTRNIYGVDINPESVEISRLSLWLKTARPEHQLQNLEATIRTGDSLIEDGAYTRRPFNWREAFPEVFARGGFDIVIGNPPYVRMEFIKPFEPYLEKHFVVTADRADLYAYFFERGVGLLKGGGRLGYISSSTFFRTGSGENLRTFLTDNISVERVVDFGDLQIFEGVTTYPAILTLKKSDEKDGLVRYMKMSESLPPDLGGLFREKSATMPRTRLDKSSWRLEGDALAALRAKIAAGRKTLGEVYGAPLYGIKTGLNDAFVIDTPTRERLVKADPKSADLLQPFLRGEDIKRWRVEPQGLWLINTPKGKVDIEQYPAVRDWLLPFREKLEKRATKQEWWELQQAQLAYQPRFLNAKISYPHFQDKRMFCLEESGAFSNDKSYFIESGDLNLLAYLNSKMVWSYLISISPAVRNNWHEMRVQYVETLPIPSASAAVKRKMQTLAQTCTTKANSHYDIYSSVRHRILDLAPPDRRKLNIALENWHELDFPSFRDEIKKAFRADIPLKERGAWEKYLTENAATVKKLNADIEAAERDIDRIVYDLFDLTPDEIELLESTISGQK